MSDQNPVSESQERLGRYERELAEAWSKATPLKIDHVALYRDLAKSLPEAEEFERAERIMAGKTAIEHRKIILD